MVYRVECRDTWFCVEHYNIDLLGNRTLDSRFAHNLDLLSNRSVIFDQSFPYLLLLFHRI